MLFVWLWWLIKATLKLFVPPPKPKLPAADPKIDINAMCPVCGHCDGEITSRWQTPIIMETMAGKEEQKIKLGDVYVEHLCHICKSRWYVKPLQDVGGKVIANA